MVFKIFVLFQGYPRLIADDWFGVTRVEACLTFLSEYTLTTLDSGEITYLFFNGSYKVFVNLQPIGFKRNVTLNWSLPATPNAAFQWSRTGLVYFAIGDIKLMYSFTIFNGLILVAFTGDAYFRYTSHRQTEPDAGYPRKLSSWDERITKLDAAFQSSDRKTYFLVGPQVFEIDDDNFTVRTCVYVR